MSWQDRLLAKIDQRGPDECWPFTGYCSPHGYGQMRGPGQRVTGAHRLAYMLWVGPIPEGHDVDHVAARGCVLRNCCNWHHLEAVTPTENGRRVHGDECRRGHVRAVAGYHWRGRGRSCAACNIEDVKRAKARASTC